jgi:hypothetical protein
MVLKEANTAPWHRKGLATMDTFCQAWQVWAGTGMGMGDFANVSHNLLGLVLQHVNILNNIHIL